MSADRKKDWIGIIWNDIHNLLGRDAYFRLWLKIQDLAKIPYGPMAGTIIDNYVAAQLAAIRRLCDRRKQDDVISIPKLLELIREEQPHRGELVDSLLANLRKETHELYDLATHYVAHNADPTTTRNWKEWNLTSAKLLSTYKAICEVAIIIERDVLMLTDRVKIIRAYQRDVREEAPYLSEDQAERLREFWREHNDRINSWRNVLRFS